MTLIDQLVRDEGERFKPYRDSVGKLTIGVGRNLDDVGISSDESRLFLQNDIVRAVNSLNEKLPWVGQLDEIRQAVLINMCFNLGIDGLLKFKQTLTLVQQGDYPGAADEMLRSTWATQIGPRALRLSRQMREGVWV